MDFYFWNLTVALYCFVPSVLMKYEMKSTELFSALHAYDSNIFKSFSVGSDAFTKSDPMGPGEREQYNQKCSSD